MEGINWFIEHAEGIIALGVIALGGATAATTWVLRMLLSRELKGPLDDLAKIKKMFLPDDGPPMVDTFQKAISTMNNAGAEVKRMAGDVEAIKIATQANESMQWAVISTSKEPFFRADANGNTLKANRALLDLVERSFEEIAGRNWEVMIHPLDREDGIEAFDEALKRKRAYEGSYRIVARRSGKVWRVKVTAQPLFCAAGNLTGYLGRYETWLEAAG